jgi:serine/threonine protein kinase
MKYLLFLILGIADCIRECPEYHTVQIGTGRGGCAMVNLVKFKHDERIYAEKLPCPTRAAENIREAKILQGLEGFKGISNLKCMNKNNSALVLEYNCGGDLSNPQDKTYQEIQLYVAQLIVILERLADKKIVHMDVKPSNLMLNEDRVVLIDFGMANNLTSDNRLYAGSILTMSPEIAYRICTREFRKGEDLTRKVDVFALGATVWDIYLRKLYGKERVTIDIYCHVKFDGSMKLYYTMEKIDKKIPHVVADFIEKLTNRDASMRPEYSEIKQMEYFKEIDWKSIERMLEF